MAEGAGEEGAGGRLRVKLNGPLGAGEAGDRDWRLGTIALSSRWIGDSSVISAGREHSKEVCTSSNCLSGTADSWFSRIRDFTMNVPVSENAERIIRLHVQSGLFSSESEVIDAALGLLNQRLPEAAARTPITEAEFKQQLLEAGLMTSLPIPLDPGSRRNFQAVKFEGEPVSETIIRERR